MREYYKDTMPSKGGQPSRPPPADREITFAEFEKRYMAKLRSDQVGLTHLQLCCNSPLIVVWCRTRTATTRSSCGWTWTAT